LCWGTNADLMKRLGALVIGDEILAGHTQESNVHGMAKILKKNGIKLARLEICSDELSDIESSVRRFFNDLNLDYIVTSGGLGPTHDDRTMEGIARAVGQKLVLTDDHEAWMRERAKIGHEYGYLESPTPNAGLMKMAYLPEGAIAMPNQVGNCLGAIVEVDGTKLFTLPGVPREFERMFEESVLPLLQLSAPDHVAEVILYTEESKFYEILRDLETETTGVSIGSYPQRGHIIIRATGPEADAKSIIEAVRLAGANYLEPRSS
jgi:nicotinamide-nucleotide amidase